MYKRCWLRGDGLKSALASMDKACVVLTSGAHVKIICFDHASLGYKASG